MINKIKHIFSKSDSLREHELPQHLRTGTMAEHIARDSFLSKFVIALTVNMAARLNRLIVISKVKSSKRLNTSLKSTLNFHDISVDLML